MTMQQLVGMMQGLQEAMAASKAEQERMQADLAASHARNDELHRANEELRRGWHGGEEHEAASPPREFTTPFSQAILETAIPNTFTGPKVTDGDQAQVDMEANHQEQEEVEAQMEDAHGVNSPPQRLTRSLFKALGANGRLFSLFVISLC